MRSLLFMLTVLLAAAWSLTAQDWGQWRGPTRDGQVAQVDLPESWPERLNRKWRLTVGVGHSSPVVAGDRVYQFSRLDDRESLAAIEKKSGKVIWRKSYPAPYKMSNAALAHGKGPKSTPVLHEGRICTLGISGILSCWDAANGELLWRKEFSKRFRLTSPRYGTAMSPMVDGDRLIAHVGGHGAGALTAFNLATGEEEWRWNGDGPGYTSPIIVELGGARQLVTQTENKIAGFSPETGRLLWEIPFKTPHAQNAVSPIAHQGVLLLSGLSKPTMAVRVSREAEKWTAEKLWEDQDSSMYMSSPVLIDGLLFGFAKRNSGQYFCQDPKTGKILWTGKPRSGDNAAILAVGDVLVMLTDEAELTIARASAEKLDRLAHYSVADSPTWAHPVPVDGGLLIKDLETLTLWSW